MNFSKKNRRCAQEEQRRKTWERERDGGRERKIINKQ